MTVAMMTPDNMQSRNTVNDTDMIHPTIPIRRNSAYPIEDSTRNRQIQTRKAGSSLDQDSLVSEHQYSCK